MAEVQTRRIARADLSAVLSMAHGLAAHHGDVASVTLDDLARDMLGAQPWVTALVAVGPDGVSGYAALCPLAQVQFGVRGMDMHHLFVVPAYRGQGIARALIAASIAEAKRQECRYITVGTHPDNTAAQEVYRASGFEDASPPGPRFRMKW